MKLTRSTKCSLKFATQTKHDALKEILTEYGTVVNFFINSFWDLKTPPTKGELLKPIIDLPTTWFSFRFRKVAAREALSMIKSAQKQWGEKAVKPTHNGCFMYVSSTIANLQNSKDTKEFDAWLVLWCIGSKIKLDIPIRFHKHFNRLAAKGKRLNSYIITEHYVQFAFKIETGLKRTKGINLGIDTGINALASLSDGRQLGCHRVSSE